MKKHYFELDKVDSITLTMERNAGYIWKDAIPARPKKFLGFIIGTKPAIPAGWSEYLEEDQYDLRRRVQSTYFENYKWYRVDESAKQVWHKAHVEVRFGYKQSIGHNFESNEEAQAWVDDLVSSSKKKFQIIIAQ